MEILDVGCGCKPRGTVNVDRFRFTKELNRPLPRGGFRRIKTRADVIATGEYLPFVDGAFDKVCAYHVIEHSSNIGLFLCELLRVSRRKIEILHPHRFGRLAKSPFHRSYLNQSWWKATLERLQGIRFTIRPIYEAVPLFSIFYILRISTVKICVRKTDPHIKFRLGASVERTMKSTVPKCNRYYHEMLYGL
jgi:hypothetical protein